MVQYTTAGIIQARMSSTRLPGKVMLPLGDCFDLEHVIHRVKNATQIDEVVVATSMKQADDIIAWCTNRTDATVFRGDEANVLDRMYRAATAVDAAEIVRITADCPLVDPAVIDRVVTRRREVSADYSANILKRTFPRGLDVEAFSAESFDEVQAHATEPAHLEHVTQYYRDNPEVFDLVNVTSDEVFDEDWLRNRTDLRLTLDEADDYKLVYGLFENLEYELTPSFPEAVRYIDEQELSNVNASVVQKSTDDASGNQS